MGWVANDQDQEDFEQEYLIRKWLNEGKKINRKFFAIDLNRKLIGRKGSARYLGITTQRYLQEEIGQDAGRTLEDFIIGSDGRDLENGGCDFGNDAEGYSNFVSLSEYYLTALGLTGGTKEWAIKTWLKLAHQNSSHLERSLIDSEW